MQYKVKLVAKLITNLYNFIPILHVVVISQFNVRSIVVTTIQWHQCSFCLCQLNNIKFPN